MIILLHRNAYTIKSTLFALLFFLCCGCYTERPGFGQEDSANGDATTAEYVCPPCGCASDGVVFGKPGTCPSCGMELVNKQNVINVAIVIWQGVELLDFSGPGEVFAAARGDDGRYFQVFTVSKEKQPVISQGFLSVNPQYSIDDCPPVDIVVLPGGGTGSVTNDPEFMAWVKRTVADSDVALSVCTGAFILAEHGFLDGREATTWHGAIDRLQQQFPDIQVQDNQRFVDNGQIITSAGVSAGIDSSLYVVARLLGTDAAVRTARYMEYDWKFEDHTMAPKRKQE